MPLAFPIAERTLGNGLRVVINEDHNVPAVAVNLWVRVGSRHEAPGKTGFAHLFEHLMFQGSRHVASGEHFAALMAEGGRLNATTWFDRTNYFETVPSGALELALWMEADRHGYLLDAVTQENLDNQRDVVKEEKRQRYDNVPYGHALATMYATVFPPAHGYAHPTIGSMADLDAATLQDVRAFFRRHYVPGNTVLTLAGDIAPDDGFAAVERHFGALPAGPAPHQAPTPPLAPLPGVQRVEVTDDVPTPRLYVGFRLPVDNCPEFFAASCAVDILGSLATARLDKTLVRARELCTSVSGGAMGLVDGVSLGYFVLEAADGAGLSEIEDVFCQELDDFGRHGPTDADMEAVMAQTERSWLSALAGLDERADALSHYTCLHDDPHGVNTFLDRLELIGPDDVTSASQRWLRPEARAVVAYVGQPSGGQA
jgi:predicted Zn-dependent peptidase